MKLEKKLAGAVPALASSADADKVSLTLKGLVPLVLVLLLRFGVDVSAEDLVNLIELGVGAAGAVALFIGAVRKIVKKNQN